MRWLPPVPVRVTTHAREQARARFPGFKAARIIDEVRLALCQGRFFPGADEGLIHVYTPDEERVYALRVQPHALVVVTTMRELHLPA